MSVKIDARLRQSSSQEDSAQRDADAALEARILAAHRAFSEANRRGQGKRAQELWQEFVALIAQRSPERVEQMEHDRGLR